ncbi:MAG TPA: transporter substrate-binding domain-containing protein [Stellaceae bacterium]|nr:transporter substrate-binding domain-containing protein [Stellaceae bacterium]
MHIAHWRAWVRFCRIQRAPGLASAGAYVVALLLLTGGVFARADVVGTPIAQAAQTQIPLTETERAWVQEHPSIRVHNETDWPPYNFAEDGEPRGYSIDFMNLVAQRIGLQVHYVTGPPRSAFVPMLRGGELDVLLNIIRTPERTQEFLFTPPYLRIAPVILSRKGQPYANLEQLTGKTVVIPDGFFYQEFVRQNFPLIKIVPAANTQAAIETVAGQQADAALGERAVLSYLMGQEKVEGLVISPDLDLLDPELALARMATRKDNPILAGLLTKAIDSVGLEDRRKLERKWLGDQTVVARQWARAELSDAELVWLDQHPNIRLGVNPNYPPFDFLDERGAFSGVSADYVDLIAKRLGIAMTVVPDLSWTEAVDGTKTGRVDVVVGIKETEDRHQSLNFTPDYLTFPMVIMTREAHPLIVGLGDLRGRTLALGQGYAVDQEIARRYPEINQRLFATLADALVAVKRGDADASVMNLGTASYLLAKHKITGLVVAAPAGLEDARSAFGIRKDWPELAGIMAKALASITPEEEAAIRSKWITAPYDEHEATEKAQRLAFRIAGVAGVLILAFLLWNYRLKRQVRERRRAEEIVAAKEAELRDMFERSPVSVIITNPEGAVRYVNSSWLRLLNISKDELAEFRAENLHFDPDQREHFVKSIQQSGSLRDVEFTVRRGDGQPIDVLLSADLYDYRGEACIVSWFIDITERKSTEQALAEAERLLRDMTNSVPGAVFQLRVTADGSRVYTFISDGVSELSGIGSEEARRDYDILWRLVFDEDKQPFEQAIIRAISTVKPITHDFRIRRPDGGVRSMQVRAVPRAEPDGAIIFNGYWVDMTQQREMEQALAEAERLLRDTTDNIPGAVYQARYTKDGDRSFTFASGGLVEVAGITAAALMRDNGAIARLVFDEDKPSFNRAIEIALSTLSTMTYDFRIRRPDGSVRWINTRAVPRREPDGSTTFNGYWVDVSQQREMEEALERAKTAADAANEAKSTFLASMSHEIRTPMNGVLGMLELLSLSLLDNEQRQRLDVVRDSSHSLLRIIDDILDFSKIEAGRLDLSPTATSIAQLVDGVRDIYSGVASSKSLVLVASVDPRISPAVTVDPLRLRQILNNLVSNAIKFTSRGSVTIAAELIVRAAGIDTVRFAVTDTGIGISPEDQQHLFQPFVQAEASTSRRFGGTGLGLTISRRIADMMGGTITMESQLGRGTTMQLVVPLPIADPDDIGRDEEASPLNAATLAARRSAPSNEEAAQEGTLVLIADDHSTNRLTVRSQLNLLGYASEAVEDGRQALELWQSGLFGLVISDCHMPEMDGYDLARAIRRLEASNGGGHTPIIACTANAMEGEAEACLAAGMDDYLAKPVELRALLGILDRWLPLPDGPARALGATPPGPMATRLGAMAESLPLDRSRLAQLSGGSDAVEREILADFRGAMDNDAAEMAAALADVDCQAMEGISHRMKGASLMVGALPLAAICERMEAASGVDDHAAIAVHREPLLREIERLKHYLTEICGAPSPPS